MSELRATTHARYLEETRVKRKEGGKVVGILRKEDHQGKNKGKKEGRTER
jgi:hypothetical protein